jgi:hypothetical protein
MWLFFFAEITAWKEPYKVYVDRMAEHRRLGERARCFEHTERISGRRAKTILMPIWALKCVINVDRLSCYYYYYYYYYYHRISRFSASTGKHSLFLGFVINRNKLGDLICNLKCFLQLNMFQELQFLFLSFICMYVFGCRFSLFRLCDSDFGILLTGSLGLCFAST